MALSNYAQLQESVISYLWDRTDLSGRVPDFIALTEADMNGELRVRQMEATAPIVLTDGVGPLPDDYLAWRYVYADSDPTRPLAGAEPNWAIQKYPGAASSDPIYFYISGSSIYTKPVCASNLTMYYYQKIPPLEENTSGNWVLRDAPAIYLYGALLHAAPFLDDDQRIQTWGTMRNEAVALLRAIRHHCALRQCRRSYQGSNTVSLQFSTNVRNAMLDAIESTIGTSAILRLRSGSVPATCATADSGTVIATYNLASD